MEKTQKNPGMRRGFKSNLIASLKAESGKENDYRFDACIYPPQIEPDCKLAEIDKVRKQYNSGMPIEKALKILKYVFSGGQWYPSIDDELNNNRPDTSRPGLIVNDGLAYATESDDENPLADGYAHDSFDVMRIVAYGASWDEMYRSTLEWLKDDDSGLGHLSDDQQAAKRIGDQITDALSKAGIENVEVNVQAIYSAITGAFWSGSNQRLHILTPDARLNQYTAANAVGALARHHGSLVDYSVIREAIAEKTVEKGVDKIPGEILMGYLQDHNQSNTSEWRVDMFAESDSVRMVKSKARINLEHRPFNASHKIDDEIVADYKKHFPRFDDFLDFVVNSRFASDRKQSYLWIRANSDWGKSFLMSTLGESVVTTSASEVEAMFSGSPVGKQPEDFTQCLVLAIDEFKSVKSEIKQLQSELILSPKNQMTTKVPIYAKLFLSAENVDSLVSENGVEDQFANRMSVFEESGDLKERGLYKKVGKKDYFDSVSAYVADYLNREIKKKQDMGEHKAAYEADNALFAFIKKYGLDTLYNRLSDSMSEIADDIIDWIEKNADNEKYNITLMEQDGNKYLRNASKVIGEYLNETFDRVQLGTMGRKKSELVKLISEDGRGVTNYRLKGKPTKCVKLAKQTESENETNKMFRRVK